MSTMTEPTGEEPQDIRECPTCGDLHDVAACGASAAVCDCCRDIRDYGGELHPATDGV